MIYPEWPAPENVRAVTTTRSGGVSVAPYDQLNLADHVNDAGAAVQRNREIVHNRLNLPAEPVWLSQIHGTRVVDAARAETLAQADASFTTRNGVVSAVLTADCLPVLFCDRAGSCVAAAHAGWRGLSDGILEATVKALPTVPEQLLAWLGPAIGPQSFEVGNNVYDAFVSQHPQASEAFVRCPEDRWLADLYQLATIRLAAIGLTRIYGGGFCTFLEEQRFFSYRRDQHTGRMASLIWLQE